MYLVMQCILHVTKFTYLVVTFYFYQLSLVEFAISSSTLMIHGSREFLHLTTKTDSDRQ